ncbi:MAG TPA: CvpA family protein [Haliscomenobacter sp.]|uniref:CvpA family protein n=1 Tax=Haliscomenobacter sp. TaxID=2717303 RepID=UPI002C04DECE|nr:CvpA family protein [Haliscomenobacter sp.]HOY17846.1 CvpA family protein [Haliscomenobacter sp.]
MIIDVLFLIVAAAGFWYGYSRGIIETLVRYISILFGIMASLRFSPAMTNFLKDLTQYTSPLMFLAGFLLTLFLTMFLLRTLGRGLVGILQTININFINQILGGVFSAAFSSLIYSCLLWFVLASATTSANEAVIESRTYVYLKDYPKTVWGLLRKAQPIFVDFWEYSLDVMDEVQDLTEKTETEDIYNIEDQEDSGTVDENSPYN